VKTSHQHHKETLLHTFAKERGFNNTRKYDAGDFGFTGVLGKQAHSRLRNWFSSAAVKSKDKSDSGIIEFSFLRNEAKTAPLTASRVQQMNKACHHQ